MNRDRIRQLLPVITAFAEGKTIQLEQRPGHWVDAVNVYFWDPTFEYRVKPEPKLRPWTAEEVPVGRVVRLKGEGTTRRVIVASDHACVALGTTNGGCMRDTRLSLLREFVMDDGSPCGVPE